ncbi:unnamed protein product [Allacma fusca]|uniref:RanBP2-type domain-containing protein n=1 Tax=Allacma fusca TaxID=39272 RepID=A0A8J2PJN3_9HEXA|nr:unnamed protein product [Allacma fusca]
MIPYKRSTAPEHVRQLYEYIAFHHEQFCKTDDSDKKCEALRLLKGYAEEYLNQVVQAQKFKTPAVESVLNQSIVMIEDFDPREASEAFAHLAKYGQNLLDQPWRPEFKMLHLSSGYYIHNVQAYLENAHEVLIAMGYANIDDDTLQLARLPNPSFLKEVSRDCFVASQECLILSKIWDYVRSQLKNCDITPAEVYHYRRTHIGDVPTIGKKICYDIHRRQHDEYLRKQELAKQQIPQQRNGYSSYDCPVDYLVDVGDVGLNRLKSGDLPERELARNVLHYTQREQENIYDPVSNDDFHTPSGNLLSPNSPSINSSSSNFMYNGNGDGPTSFVYPGSLNNGFLNNTDRYPNSHNPPDFGLPLPNMGYDRRSDTRSSTSSPYIPKTVSNYRSSSVENAENFKPIHSSSSSSSSRAQEKSERSRQPLHSAYGLNTNSTVKSSRTAEASAAKYMYNGDRNNAEEDCALRDALEYRHGVQNLVQNHKPNSIESAYTSNSKYSQGKERLPVESKLPSSRLSSDRESLKTSSSSSETYSWGYNKQPPDVTSNSREDYDTYIGRQKTGSRSHENHRPVDNSRMGKSTSKQVEYETEYQREYSKGKAPPTETNLDSLETVYYNKLLSSNPPDSNSDPRTDPNLSNNDRVMKQSHKELGDVTDKAQNIRVQLELENKSKDFVEDAYGKKKSSSQNERRRDKVKDDNGSQKNHKPNDDMDIPGSNPEPWQCPHCTYVNHAEGNICEICAKSRDFKFDEEIPTLKLDTKTLKGSSGAAKPSSSQPSPNLRSYSSVARSASSNSNREETNTSPPKESPASVSSDQIACPQCTYLNPKTRVLCEVCDCRLRQGAQ